MIKIAVCDDNPEELSYLKGFLDAYKQTSNMTDITYDSFSNATELLSKLSTGEFYDLIFMDVVMPVISGIDAAREIYSTNKLTQIVFLTSSKDFAIQSYEVEALDYILKPITDSSFKKVMQKFLSRQKKTEIDEIIIREKSSITRIALCSLCYVDVYDHYVFYHLSSGEVIKSRQKLSAAEEILAGNQRFIKPHRSYVVNMDYIQHINQSAIRLSSGEELPVSKASYKTTADAFLKYRFERGAQ